MELSKLISEITNDGYSIKFETVCNMFHIVLGKRRYYLARDFSFSEIIGSPENFENFLVNIINKMVEDHKEKFEA